MAHTVNVNFKLDEDVKKRMERACAEMGLSTVFRLRFRLIRSTRKGTSATWKALCRM